MVSRDSGSGPSIGVVSDPVGGRLQQSTSECPSLAAGVFGAGAGARETPVSMALWVAVQSGKRAIPALIRRVSLRLRMVQKSSCCCGNWFRATPRRRCVLKKRDGTCV